MAALRIGGQLALRASSSKLLKPQSLLVTSERTQYWNRDWKPEPVAPRTPEEHAAAAAKYGMLPQDYRPMPDDGTALGDYPDVPLVSAEARDPYYNWDMPELRRDFCEPIHHSMDMYGEDRYNADRKLRISIPEMWAMFLGVMASYTLVFLYFEDKKMFRPVMPKQFAKDGPHYTFEMRE
ncbi:NADH dehydrogenase [ubiquinone] 1 beta subcomplex subunit 8, mitochondrial-like [Pollicipes pollicipes]|uniref:NADH dehydrogenase [ubiquinone] 1 beta subcomplex subunit 8, mitochondrial-like n=1 Tax=Pollicipes pollicipes TaxID=41117 RepID=UPI0018858527|nr:NADH dehydrogenase [ubiquinone] 1 beta subcomplex subunit 8, mitochondrial-like [Pollicipes pollicipes]